MKAKTKLNRILYLLAILGVVFAFSIGHTYAAISLSLNTGSNLLSTTTYLAKQENVIINDTDKTPIAFGLGGRSSEVSIQYSYSYDFDIRIQYSLSWSNGKSTDNVILRFADRDSFIVDNNYIYYKDSITAGAGNLKIITGVDFTDPTDNTYAGAGLTINANVEVYKAQTSYSISSHELTKDIQTAESAKAWIWYKNRASQEKAYAIVYNLRSTYANGVDHPGSVGAYRRTYSTSSDTKVDTSKWIGGSREYAGMGVYLITGSNPYKLQVRVSGSWRNESGVNKDTGDAFIYINNIKFNYTSDFKKLSMSSDNVFENYTYNYTVPAYTAVYIELLDGVEVTSAADLNNADYTGYRILSNIYLNDFSFLSGTAPTENVPANTYYFTDGIASVDALGNTNVSGTTEYKKSAVTVYNTTTFNSALFNYHDATKANVTSQSYFGNASIVNNTADTLSVTVSYSINIYVSNGSNILFTKDNDNNYIYGQNFSDTNWYRELIPSSTGFAITGQATSVVLAPYSSANVLEQYTLSIASLIADYNNSDAYVEVIISTSTAQASTGNNLQVEVGISGNNYVLSLKNNSDVTLTNVSGTLEVTSRTPLYTKENSEPADWKSNFWEYYSDNQGTPITGYSVWGTDTVAYSLSYTIGSVDMTTTTALNDFTFTATGFSNSKLTLSPGESIVMGTIPKTSNVEYVFETSATASTTNANGTIAILFNGTDDAYIYNNTTTNYYVKFDGTISATLEHINTIDSVNYYVGIVRPGQIVKIPMSAKSTTFTTAVAGNTYSLPTGWGSANDSVDTMYKNYFGR